MFNQLNAMNGIWVHNGEHRPGDRWADSTLVIADGRVLATPVEDDHLYCLHLLDGHQSWKLERVDNENHVSYLYIGCVHGGNVLLVGQRHITAVKLADGQRAWGPVELPSGAAPSGRGFFSGEHYLPLSTAEIAEIDLKTGAIPRPGSLPPGNGARQFDLLWRRRDQPGVDFVEAYPQMDALRNRSTKFWHKIQRTQPS